ncbi:MAG: putative N-acyltransferase, partial [Enterobacterales bacterium]
MKLSVKQFNSINQFDQKSWDALNINKNPFLNYHFLNALESSASVSTETGWEVVHLGWFDQEGVLQAAMPQYYKTHSYGEYMFDWAWAEGITKAGIPYYPKVVSAIPFTPVSGQRFMLS